MIGEQENCQINSSSIEIHFDNNGKGLSIQNLIELNMMLLGIQSLLPEYDFEVAEIRKGSIIEILTGDIAGIFVLATILYRASKAVLELKKSDREIKKIESETRKIEEERRAIRIENDNKEDNAENEKNLLAEKKELYELVQILHERSVDVQNYIMHSNDIKILEKAKKLNDQHSIKKIILRS